jgi:trigger factor
MYSAFRSRQKNFRRLDDEFVSDVSEKSETVDAYKAEVKAKIKEQQSSTKERKSEKTSL